MTPNTGASALRGAAEDIAHSHTVSRERPVPVASLKALPLLSPWLERVQRELALHGAALDHETRAAEWILDNAHIVERTVRQVREDMPRSFYEQLPALATTGEPRVYALAREFVALSDLMTDRRGLARFVRAYQSVTPLRVGELWALSAMLRLCSLEVLAGALASLVPSAGAAPSGTEGPRLNLDATDSIARAIVEMRSLARMDWKQFFLSTSVVERALRGDPAGVYRRMDFETCDRYRKVVERIARRSGLAEEDVAQRAIDGAARASDPRGRTGHVGYYLVDEGREDFERELGYRPTVRERVQRLVFRHASGCYFAALVVASGAAMILPALLLSAFGAGTWLFALGMVVALLPATTLAVTVVQWLITTVLPPRVLPKLDFEKGIPPEYRTAVVIPALLGSRDAVEHLLRQIELHHLCSPHPELRFALLTDHLDAPRQHMPDDEELVEAARMGIRELNRKHARGTSGPFHLVHRERRWNAREARWMGWERKRGKLEEFNRLLLGGTRTNRVLHEGDEHGLEGVRFVITLDSDTVLPRGAAAKLASILGHPLNRAEVDAETGRVRAGYTVVQPRVEITPDISDGSRFARLFAGDGTIDIYTRAVSDVYQDLFGCALYVGKGIYDVEAFARSLEGRAAENAVLSHDLWEGLHGRVALATDVVLYEDYPPHYLAFVRRMYRWVRGDWQLLPWLRRRVPAARGERLATCFSALDVWKIVDNLRRSLLGPALLLFLASGWLFLPGHPLIWTLLGVLAPAGHLFTDLATGLARGRRRATRQPALRGVVQGIRQNGGRWLLYLVFLPFEALVVCDAIVRTLARVLVTRRHLLEWQSAFHTARLFRTGARRPTTWSEMASAPLIAGVLLVALAFVRPHALLAAAPLLLAWLVSPEIARAISKPPRRHEPSLGQANAVKLRRLARRTWLFFETFVGPDEQWLAPDNYQEEPGGQLAHRTSPTNIGMMLLSTLAAWDLGFVTLNDLSFRVRSSLAGMARLPRYRGHLLNWYDTRTLEPLLPEYVSTVDSGNLAAALLTLAQGSLEAVNRPVLRAAQWQGLLDELALLEAAVERLFAGDASAGIVELRDGIADLRRRLDESRKSPRTGWRPLTDLAEEEEVVTYLERRLLTVLRGHAGRRDAERLHEFRTWLDRFHRHLRGLRRELGMLMPWLDTLQHRPAAVDQLMSGEARAEVDRKLVETLPASLSLAALPDSCERARSLLGRMRGWLENDRLAAAAHEECASWLDEMERALAAGATNAQTLREELCSNAVTARADVMGMDFGLLYDADDHLFHIGHNVTADRLDSGHYDLLASEARLASFLAIAKGDVELLHWFHLGRPLTRVGGDVSLVSWGGTMFEYLMPTLFMMSGERTLLARSERVATDEQIRYGKRLGVPWGISESGFFRFDADRNYQYKSFGVPGLGLRRGLESDLVVSPYASMLALATRPHATLRNLERLEELGALGHFGFYEALDFTPERVPEGADFRLVRSYMAHHQGMILLALDNAVNGDIMRRRFHNNALVRTAAQLLFERVPLAPKVEFPQHVAADVPSRSSGDRVQLEAWSPVPGAVPEILALGNGRLTTLITDGEGGGLRWNEWNLTRWVPDATQDHIGYWIHLCDEESGDVWSVTGRSDGVEPQERQVTFHAHMAEFHWRDGGLSVRTEIGVAAFEDLEFRRVTLTNETARPRRITLASHADVTLDLEERFEAHPAFRRLFVESEFLPEVNALLFRRRSGDADERPPLLLHRFVRRGTTAKAAGFETSREHFIGRLGSERVPRALRDGLQGHEGATLDPTAALAVSIELLPHGSEQVTFVTIAGSSRASVMEIMRRFETPDALEWALAATYSECCREASLLGLRSAELPLAQRLLSRLIHSASPACVPADVVAANRLGRSRLWGMGISGDRPLLLLHVRDSGGDRLALQALRFHHLWRRRGVEVDVVVMQHAVSGYGDEALSGLRDLVAREGAQEWLARPGGIFLLRADQISPEDCRLLEVVAQVVLDSREGDLAGQVPETPARTLLPSLPATSPPGESVPPVPRPDDLLHDNGYGGFTPDGREYVIHLEPGRVTPAPWCNVLANPRFGSLLTESGGGYTWALNSGENRLTPWTNDPVVDPPGEVVYLRDEPTAEVWTTTLRPAGSDATCQVRHGAGYTEFRQHSHGLEQRMRVFVAATDPVKIVRLSLRDAWNRPRRVTVTYYAEWVLGPRRAGNIRLVVPDYDPLHGVLLARNPWNPEFGERVAFLASDRTPHGFTTDRTEFVGREGDLARPAALTRWGLSGEVRAGRDPCAALQVHVDIEPGGEATLHFVLGQGDDASHARDLVTRYRDPVAVEAAQSELEAHWDERLGAVQVKTPEPAMDLLLNRWLLYQALSSRLLGRTGFYQSSGAFGFRDQLQDAMALVHVDPVQLRRHLLECARHQFEAGDVLHWWHPPAGRGVRTRCSDDMLWLPWVTAFYVDATGDAAVLDEKVAFLTGEPLGEEEHQRYEQFTASGETASLFEHCRRSLECGVTQGAHGLPLIGDGDWNDGMNRVGQKGRGESVWLAWFATSTVDGFARLCDDRGEDELASIWRGRADEIARAVERTSWDGEWYRRAYDDAGHPLGSAEADECQIDSIAQSWAVLCGSADPARAGQALRSAEARLVRESGRLACLLWPPFDRTPRDPGYIKAYPPGIRENGGQYTHAAVWLAWAFARRADGERAERLFRLMNPILHARTPQEVELYRVEPYVIAADVAGAPPHVGRGGWTWYTGSASWAWRLGVEAILGLQRAGGRLRIDPCLPPAWEGFEARVRGPHGSLRVHVTNPDGAGRGVAAVEVDGIPTSTNEVAFPEDGGERHVHVWLGTSRLGAAKDAP